MRRRGFLKRMLGTAAVTIIAPDILKLIEEYEYVVEEKPRPKPYNPFAKYTGFWAIYKEQIIAWSTLDGMSLNMETPAIDVTSMDSGGWREFIPGPMSANFTIDNLVVVHLEVLKEVFAKGLAMDIVASIEINQDNMQGGPTQTFSGKGTVTEIGFGAMRDEPISYSARFDISGELIRNDD